MSASSKRPQNRSSSSGREIKKQHADIADVIASPVDDTELDEEAEEADEEMCSDVEDSFLG